MADEARKVNKPERHGNLERINVLQMFSTFSFSLVDHNVWSGQVNLQWHIFKTQSMYCFIE